MEEEEQAIVEQPSEEPTTPSATPTPSDDENSPPSFLKEIKEEYTKSLHDIYEVTERLENLIIFFLLPIVSRRTSKKLHKKINGKTQ